MGRLLSAADVEQLAARGRSSVVLDPGTILSPLARDRARELGLELVRSQAAGPSASAGGDPDRSSVEGRVRQTLEGLVAQGGGHDLQSLIRETVARLTTKAPAAPARQPIGPILQDRVAVVTGASSGIGQATARAFAEAGARVVIGTFADDPHDAQATLSTIDAIGGEAKVVSADVRRTDEVEALCRTAIDSWGRLDIAVANAGVLRRDPIRNLTDAVWTDVLDVDLGGVMRVCRAASSAFTGPGSIIAVGSIAGGVFGWEEHSHYAAAKAGILGLVRSLAAELGSREVRVNAVLPGLVETPQSLDPETSIGAEGLSSARAAIPLRRVGDAQEIASVVRFLASDEASYLTGQSVVVDGGVSTSLSL